MFFVLSKLLLWLLQPLTVVLIGLAVAYAALRRGHARVGQRLVLACLLTLTICGISPVSTILMVPLEDRFARVALAADARVDGIVVLGGAEDAHVTLARQTPTLNDAGERMSEAMSLAHRFPKARIVFSGGWAELTGKPEYGADAAELFFREQGLDPGRLSLERWARNTHENAVLTKALMAPRPGERWLLVTSAYHMPRAMGCFRRAGWDVAPWPVDYRTIGRAEMLHPFDNPLEGMRRLETALKEWVGLAAYWATGRTDALFPRPTG